MKWGVCSAAFRPYLVPGIRAEARTTNMFTIACVVLLPHFIRLKCYAIRNRSGARLGGSQGSVVAEGHRHGNFWSAAFPMPLFVPAER